MRELELLLKTVLLLLLEKKTFNDIQSIPLAKDVYNTLKDKFNYSYSTNNDLGTKLFIMLSEIINAKELDADSFIESLLLYTSENQNLNNLIREIINKEFTLDQHAIRIREVKRMLLKDKLYNIGKNLLLKLKNSSVTPEEALNEFEEEKNKIIASVDYEDEAYIGELDVSNVDQIEETVKDTLDMYDNKHVLRTGFKCLNEMTQGGLRRGELVTIAALPHNYKSGLAKTLFLQLARLNEPVLDDPKKKPLMVFLSLEEELRVVAMFIYSYLKFLKEGVAIDPLKDKVDKEDMLKYLKEVLPSELKYEIKIVRMDPTKVTFTKIKNYIEKLEKEGYEIHALFIDYLSQIDVSDIKGTGPNGTEYKNLFKAVRNEFSPKNILVVTPHQISTEAKRLIKNGIPDLEFVKYLPNKGYYAHSGQLDQEIDLELFVHKAYINRKPVLTIQRGKHRIPTQIEEDKKYIILEFPKKAPIVEDTEEKTYCKDLGSDDEEFTF